MATKKPALFGKTAIAGVGYTEFSKNSGRSVLELATEACTAALHNAGLTAADVDGIGTYGLFSDSVPTSAVATALSVPELTWALDMNSGGMAPSLVVLDAAMAVHSGLADVVVVYRALNGRSGIRVGSQSFDSATGPFRYPIGFSAYPQYMALIARRFMIETGATENDFAAVAVTQRATAMLNERAMRRRPLTYDEYFDAPYIVDPFRGADCTTEVDGACAVVVTSLRRARDLHQEPVVIAGGAWVTGRRSGLDIADFTTFPDYATISQGLLADRLWSTSEVARDDIDFAEIYDCFTSKVLLGLEALGFVGKGEAGGFIRDGHTALGGSLPVNTNGGLLCEGYLHGMNTIAEAVVQMQGRAGARQLERANAAVVTSGAFAEGSALILRKDR